MKTLSLFALSLLATVSSLLAAPPLPAERALKICVAPDAPAEVRAAAERVLAAVPTHPLLTALAGAHPPVALSDSAALMAGKPEPRAFDHLVLIGLSSDPLIAAAWQREARIEKSGDIYIGGFGHLRGDIGYLESDRNPFLHSRFIPKAPFETEVVTLSGNSPAGVALAVDAFLHQGLLNGVVAQPGWSRPEPNLLQRDPLPPDFTTGALFPAHLGSWRCLGFTQAAEDEYRGVLADTGLEPQTIWRAKYFKPGVWDAAGAAAAFSNYAAGLHRRATGNTLWAAHFATEADAKNVAPKIAAAAKLKNDGAAWKGDQPPYSSEKESPGPLLLWQRGEWVLMSTLPEVRASL